MVALLVKIGPEISRPDFWTALARPFPGLDLSWMPDWFRAQNPWVFVRLAEPARAGETWGYLSLYLANVYLPFALAVPVLYLFFWRKLIRVREFYADARDAQLVGTAETLPAALLLNATLQAMTPAPAGRTARVWMCIRRMVTARFKPGLLALHPQAEEREMALAEPLLVFGSPWKLAVWTGVALLLLELILRNSLTLSYISQPGPYLPLLTSFLVFSTWLLPQTCVGRPARGLLWQIFCLAVVFMVVKISLNILDGGLVLFSLASGRLGALGSVLDVYVRSMLGAGGADMEPVFGTADFNWPQMIDWHIVRPIAFFLFYAAPLLLVTLMVEAWLRQRALTWYVLADRLKRVFVVIVVVLALAQVLVFIPLGERLFFPMFYESWPGLSMAIGLVLLVAAGIAFGLAHRRLSCLCPGCKEHVVEPFTLGKSCPHCGMQLHPWLVAPY